MTEAANPTENKHSEQILSAIANSLSFREIIFQNIKKCFSTFSIKNFCKKNLILDFDTQTINDIEDGPVKTTIYILSNRRTGKTEIYMALVIKELGPEEIKKHINIDTDLCVTFSLMLHIGEEKGGEYISDKKLGIKYKWEGSGHLNVSSKDGQAKSSVFFETQDKSKICQSCIYPQNIFQNVIGENFFRFLNLLFQYANSSFSVLLESIINYFLEGMSRGDNFLFTEPNLFLLFHSFYSITRDDMLSFTKKANLDNVLVLYPLTSRFDMDSKTNFGFGDTLDIEKIFYNTSQSLGIADVSLLLSSWIKEKGVNKTRTNSEKIFLEDQNSDLQIKISFRIYFEIFFKEALDGSPLVALRTTNIELHKKTKINKRGNFNSIIIPTVNFQDENTVFKSSNNLLEQKEYKENLLKGIEVLFQRTKIHILVEYIKKYNNSLMGKISQYETFGDKTGFVQYKNIFLSEFEEAIYSAIR